MYELIRSINRLRLGLPSENGTCWRKLPLYEPACLCPLKIWELLFKNKSLGKIWSILKFSSKAQRSSDRLRTTLRKRAPAGASERAGLGPSAWLLSGGQDSLLTWCHLTPKAGAGHVSWISPQFSPWPFPLVFRTRKWDGKTVHLLDQLWSVSGATYTCGRQTMTREPHASL